MKSCTDARVEFEALDREYRDYIAQLRSEWLANNRSRSKDVCEVMGVSDRAEVQAAINRWRAYITPLAEAWWKERGYEVVWPDDDAKPMRVRKCVAA